MKFLIPAAMFLSLISFALGVKDNPALATESLSLPLVRAATQYPPAKKRHVEHKIKIEMTEKILVSSIFIKIPKGLKVENNILV